ncbi:MAG: pyruvate:ferredoxin (flavodoxin) oxidoreductase [Pseudomonadota bacterium]
MINNPIIIDGNHAAALIAHQTNEVIAIYPITPSSPMGELSDEWSSNGQKNLWNAIPEVIEMQSEGGAAGTVHGALQAGALTTTFTSSQGLLLMIPNMYKIAGELTPAVFHVAARSLAAQALSIFGDHSDVMAIRSTGFGMLSSNSVQEALDMALIAQAATLESRIPIVHFFDGFRTSHEVSKIESIPAESIRAMIDDDLVQQHRDRAMSPDHPVVRGTSQNPDVYFQARETVNPYYRKMPETVQSCMDRFAALSGRQYRLFEYVGSDDAENIIILMGSGCEAAHETVDHLLREGEKIGMLKVRLYRPFASETFLASIPQSVRRIAVLDRTKEPGADGEPLYKDVMTALADRAMREGGSMPLVTGGRYGLSSKEFTPAMIKGVFDELNGDQPKNHFTVGIRDDLTHTSLAWDDSFVTDANENVTRCLFYGLGSDGTVSANKNSIKIIGEETDLYTQGYFVYDSKKAGAVTVSHLRFGPDPIRSTYLIGDNEAEFVACHQPVFLERYAMLDKAAQNGVFLLNTQHGAESAWETLPDDVKLRIIEKNLRLYVIDAYQVAADSGMGRRINTVMQTCFFAISGILPKDEAIEKIKGAVEKTYGRKGRRIVERNFKAIDSALANLHEVAIPAESGSSTARKDNIPERASEFVKSVTLELIAERGNQLPVSLLPDDGTWPLGTGALEKRNLALQIPVWVEELCIHCGKCPFVCPHAAIRSKAFPADAAADSPESFKHVKIKGKEFPESTRISYQVAPEDCTGCGLCVEICPAKDKSQANRKALNMEPYTAPLREQERINWDYFLGLPEYDRTQVKWRTMKGSMLAQPLFEFSGACVGCGETPYVKLATQLFGDRMMIANATGCSSIYGGNLPTTPYTTNEDGRGPTWNNSLFEDNAEFGLGFRLAVDQHNAHARVLLEQLRDEAENKLDQELVQQILAADQSDEVGIHEQRQRVAALVEALKALDSPAARELLGVTDYLVKKSVWIVGGDGWAYDIGFGGLDHAMASGRDINILVLDTEVYSNTGGQASKATPLGAVAKFAASGKGSLKKDLSMIAMAYENVYVAHVAFGAKDMQTLRTFMEAEAYPGPSLIIAYSPCIAHGVDLKNNLKQQDLAIKSGHWQLFRFDPRLAEKGKNPLQLDSKEPSIPFNEFADTEIRFSMLRRTHPEQAEEFMRKSGEEARARFDHYKQLADIDYTNDAVLTELPEDK